MLCLVSASLINGALPLLLYLALEERAPAPRGTAIVGFFSLTCISALFFQAALLATRFALLAPSRRAFRALVRRTRGGGTPSRPSAVAQRRASALIASAPAPSFPSSRRLRFEWLVTSCRPLGALGH